MLANGLVLDARIINGVVFSDLGQASSFMGLDWVQEELQKLLGFAPFPATLNIRPDAEGIQVWRRVRTGDGIPLPPAQGGFCAARLFPVKIHAPANRRSGSTPGAVLLPEIADYPENKIEIVAAASLKETLGIRDGDRLMLELVVE